MNRKHVGKRLKVKGRYIGIHVLASVRDRHGPKAALDLLSLGKDALHALRVGRLNQLNARFQIVSEKPVGLGPVRFRQNVALQPGGPDLVRVLPYKLLAGIKTVGGDPKRKG